MDRIALAKAFVEEQLQARPAILAAWLVSPAGRVAPGRDEDPGDTLTRSGVRVLGAQGEGNGRRYQQELIRNQF